MEDGARHWPPREAISLILAVVYIVTSYGLVPMARWAFIQVFRQLGGTLALFTQGLPLLLLAFLFLFINAEVWQVAGTLDDAYLVAVLGLFLTLGVLFIVSRLPRESLPWRGSATGPASSDSSGARRLKACRPRTAGYPRRDHAAVGQHRAWWCW